MHDSIALLVTIWLFVLVAALAARVVLSRDLIDRALAIDLLSIAGLAVLGVLAARQQRPGFLDAAFVLALLAYGQTVALAHFILERRSQRK